MKVYCERAGGIRRVVLRINADKAGWPCSQKIRVPQSNVNPGQKFKADRKSMGGIWVNIPVLVCYCEGDGEGCWAIGAPVLSVWANKSGKSRPRRDDEDATVTKQYFGEK